MSAEVLTTMLLPPRAAHVCPGRIFVLLQAACWTPSTRWRSALSERAVSLMSASRRSLFDASAAWAWRATSLTVSNPCLWWGTARAPTWPDLRVRPCAAAGEPAFACRTRRRRKVVSVWPGMPGPGSSTCARRSGAAILLAKNAVAKHAAAGAR